MNNLICSVAATYLETSTLLNRNFCCFLEEIPAYSYLCIPRCVFDQIVKFSREDDTERGSVAKQVLALSRDDHRFCIVENDMPKPAHFFLDLAARSRSGRPILIITQNSDLAYSLNRKRRQGCKVLIKRLTASGTLADYDLGKLPPKMAALSMRTDAAAILKTLI